MGVGGFGEVWKARHPDFPNVGVVALKFGLDRQADASLHNEADKLNRVMQHGRHDGIVPLLNVHLEADPPCLEYEYVEGGDLAGLIRELHQRGPVSPDEAARLMLHLASPVAFAHSMQPPLVHRDLKPANILVQRRPNGEPSLHITDFGISGLAAKKAITDYTRSTTSPSESLAASLRGAFTLLYAPPQQVEGAPADPRDDVHALGVIWLQMLTGELNKGRPAGRGWRKHLAERGVSGAMLDLLESCLDDYPAQRPADAGELARRLEELERRVTPGTGPAKSDGKDKGSKKSSANTDRLAEQIHEMTWEQFFDIVKSEPESGFGLPMPNRLETMKKMREIFATRTPFHQLGLNDRKAIAGLLDPYGWFGSMKGAGMFKQAINQNNPHLADALDRIPLDGDVSENQYLEYIEHYKQAFPKVKRGIATATRLLAMKRPDVFVCITGKNKSRLCHAFGVPLGLSYKQYWDKIIVEMKKMPWYSSLEPVAGDEKDVWRARAAFLDSVFKTETDPHGSQDVSEGG